MACESDKCEKYGLHHDYKDGVEIRKCFACERDQPERSKREDNSLTTISEPSERCKMAMIRMFWS